MVRHGRLQTLSDTITTYIKQVEYLLENAVIDNVPLKNIQAIQSLCDDQKEQRRVIARKLSIPLDNEIVNQIYNHHYNLLKKSVAILGDILTKLQYKLYLMGYFEALVYMADYPSIQPTDKQIGVFVLETFGLFSPRDFLYSTRVKYKVFDAPLLYTTLHTQGEGDQQEEIFFSSCFYHWVTPQPYQLTLLSRFQPEDYPFPFKDLEFPYEMGGGTLFINLHDWFNVKNYIRERILEINDEETQKILSSIGLTESEVVEIQFKERIKEELSYEKSGIGWLKKSGLPFIVVAVEPNEELCVNVEEVLIGLEIEPSIPIIHCPVVDNVVTMENPYGIFTPEDIERILLTLVEEIERKNG